MSGQTQQSTGGIHSSHILWGSLPILPILSAALSPVCGHPIDPTILDGTMAFQVVMGLVDWAQRHFGK